MEHSPTFDEDFRALMRAVELTPAGKDETGEYQSAVSNPEWTPTTEEVAQYFLEVLPPAWGAWPDFAVGEPQNHRGGEAVYLCFRRRDGVHQARHATVRELREDLKR